jgi:hypothetical protein
MFENGSRFQTCFETLKVTMICHFETVEPLPTNCKLKMQVTTTGMVIFTTLSLLLGLTAAQEVLTPHESVVGNRHECNDTSAPRDASESAAVSLRLPALVAAAAALGTYTAYMFDSDDEDMDSAEDMEEDLQATGGRAEADNDPPLSPPEGPEPVSRRVELDSAHNPDRMVDCDGFAGQTSAGALLNQGRSATTSVLEGGGRQVPSGASQVRTA